MKIDYFKETDSLYISFLDIPATETIAVNENINVDLDINKNLIGIDVHSGASKFNWNSLELNNMPQLKNIKFG
ncbi:MAG: DUF2283 domain-containing protein [Leptospiraceae bacterium]|jgi:uncharacterized protein YuzE|nr:DUF2283 domain-containing protein [Leptospiraceae bacterium]